MNMQAGTATGSQTKPDETKGYTRELARFVAEHSYNDIPTPVVERAKDVILDTIGCMFWGRTTPAGQIATELAVEMSGGVSAGATIVGDHRRASLLAAALANGIFAHADEFDDRNTESQTHASGAILGAALVAGEGRKIDGKKLLRSFILGHEASSHVAITVAPEGFHNGFHPAGWHSTFGAAASAGIIRDLDATKMAWAIGLAATQASGTVEAAYSSDAKILHTGKAGMSGLCAALLAEKGFTGGFQALEGSHRAPGYCRMLSATPRLHRILENLGEEYKVLSRVGLKPYSCAGDMHPGIDAVWTIMRQQGLKKDDILKIDVHSFRIAYTHFDTPAPDTRIAALLSYQHCIACAVVLGEVTPIQFTDRWINDPDINRVRHLVKLHIDSEFDAKFPKNYVARVIVQSTKGTFTYTCDASRGTPENPMTRDDVRTKYFKLATATVPRAQAEAIEKLVVRLDSLANIDELIALLAKKPN